MGLIAKPDPATAVSYNPQSQDGWITTRLDFLVNWGRANSLWPMPFGTACCAIEFMASAASKFDLARFGMERMSFSPRQSDVLICAGRVPFKLAPVLRGHPIPRRAPRRDGAGACPNCRPCSGNLQAGRAVITNLTATFGIRRASAELVDTCRCESRGVGIVSHPKV